MSSSVTAVKVEEEEEESSSLLVPEVAERRLFGYSKKDITRRQMRQRVKNLMSVLLFDSVVYDDNKLSYPVKLMLFEKNLNLKFRNIWLPELAEEESQRVLHTPRVLPRTAGFYEISDLLYVAWKINPIMEVPAVEKLVANLKELYKSIISRDVKEDIREKSAQAYAKELVRLVVHRWGERGSYIKFDTIAHLNVEGNSDKAIRDYNEYVEKQEVERKLRIEQVLQERAQKRREERVEVEEEEEEVEEEGEEREKETPIEIQRRRRRRVTEEEEEIKQREKEEVSSELQKGTGVTTVLFEKKKKKEKEEKEKKEEDVTLNSTRSSVSYNRNRRCCGSGILTDRNISFTISCDKGPPRRELFKNRVISISTNPASQLLPTR